MLGRTWTKLLCGTSKVGNTEHEHERPQLGSRYRYRTDLGTHCEVKIGTICSGLSTCWISNSTRRVQREEYTQRWVHVQVLLEHKLLSWPGGKSSKLLINLLESRPQHMQAHEHIYINRAPLHARKCKINVNF
jgi:hypothetical protein